WLTVDPKSSAAFSSVSRTLSDTRAVILFRASSIARGIHRWCHFGTMLSISSTLRRLQPRRQAPVPDRRFQALDMPIQESHGRPAIVARVRTAPVWITPRHSADVRGIVARIVQDPAAR